MRHKLSQLWAGRGFVKIVEISEFYSESGGGVRTYTHQKLEASARLGHETVIVAPGAENREQSLPGGKIVWVKSPRLIVDPRYHIFVSSSAVDSLIAREAPDILVGASPWKGGWIAGQWRDPDQRLNPVKVLFMHADPMAVYGYTLLGRFISQPAIDKMLSWFWRYLARLSACYDSTLVGGSRLARRFTNFGLVRVSAIPFGADLSTFSPKLRSENFRRSMLDACRLPETATLVLTVGRHHPEKRLDTVIAAIKTAQRTRPFGLYVVGDGLMRRRVERLAVRVPNVYVAGQINDRQRLASCMASADILLHGSGAETYGIVIAEALASGLPIVVPDQGGAADFAEQEYAEVYVTGDHAAAAHALLKIMGRNRGAAASAAENAARTRIGSDSNHFDQLHTFYAELLARRHRSDHANES